MAAGAAGPRDHARDASAMPCGTMRLGVARPVGRRAVGRRAVGRRAVGLRAVGLLRGRSLGLHLLARHARLVVGDSMPGRCHRCRRSRWPARLSAGKAATRTHARGEGEHRRAQRSKHSHNGGTRAEPARRGSSGMYTCKRAARPGGQLAHRHLSMLITLTCTVADEQSAHASTCVAQTHRQSRKTARGALDINRVQGEARAAGEAGEAVGQTGLLRTRRRCELRMASSGGLDARGQGCRRHLDGSKML